MSSRVVASDEGEVTYYIMPADTSSRTLQVLYCDSHHGQSIHACATKQAAFRHGHNLEICQLGSLTSNKYPHYHWLNSLNSNPYGLSSNCNSSRSLGSSPHMLPIQARQIHMTSSVIGSRLRWLFNTRTMLILLAQWHSPNY